MVRVHKMMELIILRFLKTVIFIAIISVGIFSAMQIIEEQARPKKLKPIKVFQIGFNRCGTVTLWNFFSKNGINSVHYDDGNVAFDFWKNYVAHKPLISSKYEKYTGYFDMENIVHKPPLYIAETLFRELDKQYPGSKFILNIRDKTKWIKSRSRHKFSNLSYLDIASKNYNISKNAVLEKWSKEWDTHIEAVLEYFKDRPKDLLVFNVETDPPEKIREFFKENFLFDVTLYEHQNKTEKNSRTNIGRSRDKIN